MEFRGGRSSRFLGVMIIAIAWVLPVLLFAAVFMEYFGGIELYQHIRYGNNSVVSEKDDGRGGKNYSFLQEEYRVFTIQRLHPLSFFSFPFSPEERIAISNNTVTLGKHGFRGTGPGRAGNRKLAFLVGGSTAFGHFASSDETTITGYLNAKQDKYHFVNAGVPSWNSTQELRRIIDEILTYDPDLIITLDGSNDVAIAMDYARKGKGYPPGSPESFDKLGLLVDDIRGGCYEPEVPFYEHAFPDLTRHFKNMFGLTQELNRVRLSDEDIDIVAAEAAEKYLWNIGMMSRISDSFGVRFMAFLQPVADLHQNVEFVPDFSAERTRLYKGFRETVIANSGRIPIYDFSSVFHSQFEKIPVFSYGSEELDQGEHIFVDNVHLTDRGNEMVAGEIVPLIRL